MKSRLGVAVSSPSSRGVPVQVVSILASIVLLLFVVNTNFVEAERIFDELFDSDVCYDELNGGTIGPCDASQFPTCDPSTSLICYNRRPRRDEFYIDTRQPKYYIDYRSVYCYPNTFQGCSSCSPGRFCRSEQRCILEELNYECSEWF